MLSTWKFDLVSVLFAIAQVASYLILVGRLRRRGHRWPIRLTLIHLTAVMLYLAVELGFFGTYRYDLRWAFTTRIALLLFGLPLLFALAKPFELSLTARSAKGRRQVKGLLKSWPFRLIGNAIFAPLFALAFFMIFITPAAGPFRQSVTLQNLVSVLAPLFGLLMVGPISQRRRHRSEIFVVAEFIFAFAELMLDAIPGVVLSINNSVLDHAGPLIGSKPAWFPTALADQHFSGNLLWMIAEAADIPILVMLFINWGRSDRKHAKAIDDLTEEQYQELAKQHLRRP